MKLSRQRQDQARTFMATAARPLEQALYAYHFENGTPEAVLVCLAQFQNADGGFGHGIEPDHQNAGSTPLATTVGLQTLRALEAPADNPLVRGAIGYLLNSYDSRQQHWPIVTAETATAPHAPWLEPDAELPQRFGGFAANPRAEIVGYLYDYAGLVPAELLETLGQATAAHLERQPDKMEMHDLLCYIRLAETEHLPPALRSRIMPQLQRTVEATVERDPAAWQAYGLPPLAVVSTPESPFAAIFVPELEANLELLLEQQRDDGSWVPSWSWDDRWPQAWASAQRDWSGVLTLANLRTLRSFGRLE